MATTLNYVYGKDELADMAVRIQEYINDELQNFKLAHSGVVISDIELDINYTLGPYYSVDSRCSGVSISLAI
jgi:uncharacterized membrane protein